MNDGLEWVLLGIFVIGIFVGGFVASIDRYNGVRECAKQHNVYDCKTEYVPIVGSGDGVAGTLTA